MLRRIRIAQLNDEGDHDEMIYHVKENAKLEDLTDSVGKAVSNYYGSVDIAEEGTLAIYVDLEEDVERVL